MCIFELVACPEFSLLKTELLVLVAHELSLSWRGAKVRQDFGISAKIHFHKYLKDQKLYKKFKVQKNASLKK